MFYVLIIQSLPIELHITFNDKYTAFLNLDPDNQYSPTVFKFLNQYVEDLNNSYKANPTLFDVVLSPMNIGVKAVKYKVPKKQDRNSYLPAGNDKNKNRRPCPLCTVKGFEADHYPLSWSCGVKKLCSKEIIKTIDDAEVCPSCCCTHGPGYNCFPTFKDGSSRICTKKCSHNNLPLNLFA